MSKWKIEASAVVSLRFDVEAEDEDEANDKALELAKQIRGTMKGGLSVPTGVHLGWPGADTLTWEDTEEGG